MFGKPGYVFKPSGTPFEVEFPQGMKGKVSTYFGPDLSTDPDKREICTLDVTGGTGNVILRVAILQGESPQELGRDPILLKYDDQADQWPRDSIQNQKYIPLKDLPWPGFIEAEIPTGDPAIAVG